MAGTSKLEYSIRRGYYTKNADGTYSVEVIYARDYMNIWRERISAHEFARICDVIRRKDWRHSTDNYTGEHSATMSDIMDAYNDYRMSMAY